MVGEVTFAVIGLLFLIADIRMFASTFQLTYYGQPNTTLAVMATAVFATSLLAPLTATDRRGPRRQPRSGARNAVANTAVAIIPSVLFGWP